VKAPRNNAKVGEQQLPGTHHGRNYATELWFAPQPQMKGQPMKYITLVAQEVVDGKKKEIAKQDRFPIAETMADVSAMVDEDNGWNEDEIVACFNYGSRVKRQTQLRAQSEAPSTVKVFKALSASDQERILKEHGLI
jgi:hypothetical protein